MLQSPSLGNHRNYIMGASTGSPTLGRGYATLRVSIFRQDGSLTFAFNGTEVA